MFYFLVMVVGLTTEANYVGCYIDGGLLNRLMTGQENFPDTLTPDICAARCLEKGFAYSGTQYRYSFYIICNYC